MCAAAGSLIAILQDLSFGKWVSDFARLIDAAAFDRFAVLRLPACGLVSTAWRQSGCHAG